MAPRPNGGYVIMHAVETVAITIVVPAAPPRTVVFDDIAPPQAFHCGWGGCLYEGPMLLADGNLVVVIGPDARRNGVLRAQISTDGGDTWSGRDLDTDIHGRMMYSLHDGALQWYAEERQLDPESDKAPIRLHGHLRLAEPRGPETARHGAR